MHVYQFIFNMCTMCIMHAVCLHYNLSTLFVLVSASLFLSVYLQHVYLCVSVYLHCVDNSQKQNKQYIDKLIHSKVYKLMHRVKIHIV